MTTASCVQRCVEALQDNVMLRRATMYLSPKTVVKATRQHRHDRRLRSSTFLVTIGIPNYRERIWVKTARKAKVVFPVNKVQLAFWPKAV